MTKSSVSQDDSLLLPPESREPCRKPAAAAGEVSVFCSWCCISPRDCGPERSPLRPSPGLAEASPGAPSPGDTHRRGGQVRGGAAAGATARARARGRRHRHRWGCRSGRVRAAANAEGPGQPPPPNLLHPLGGPRPPQPAGGRGAGTPASPRTHTSSRRRWCPEKGDGRTHLQEAGWGERGLRRVPSQGFQGQGLPPGPHPPDMVIPVDLPSCHPEGGPGAHRSPCGPCGSAAAGPAAAA